LKVARIAKLGGRSKKPARNKRVAEQIREKLKLAQLEGTLALGIQSEATVW
jgi:hypothetical protein